MSATVKIAAPGRGAAGKEWTDYSRPPYRCEITCKVTWSGPFHVGTGEMLSVATDAPVLLDLNGRPYLPGSSIRGVLRDWCRREYAILGLDLEGFERLFGPDSDRLKTNDRQARLRVFDAAIDPDSAYPIEVRDHVRIDPAWGATPKGAKFDQEVARARTGTIRMVYEGAGDDDPELVLLRSALDALARGALVFGGKTGWGLGAVSDVKIASVAEDRSTTAGLAAYVATRIHRRPRAGHALDLAQAPDYGVGGSIDPEYPAHSWLALDLLLRFEGPMLVAGPYQKGHPAVHDFDAKKTERLPDAVYQTHPDGTPFLAGSSLRGAIQAHARRIARTLEVPDVADALFGTIRARDSDGGRRGMLRVGEGVHDSAGGGPETVFLGHVAIDRVTGFSARNKLFNALALASPRFRTRLFVRWTACDASDGDDSGMARRVRAERAGAALLLLVLRDMGQGLVWVGSRTTRGYGHLKTIEIESAETSWVVQHDGRWLREAVPRETVPEGTERTIASLATDGPFKPVIDELMAAWMECLLGMKGGE